MSLHATHIRFALEVMDRYLVQDIEKYILGALYPDSRYVSGIDRELTHNEDLLLPEFAKDDFRSGWQAHQMCDVAFTKKQKEIFPDLFVNCDGQSGWVTSSAIKIIQDMNDFKYFDMQSNLKYLENAFAPNGEDVEAVKRFNRLLIDVYKDKKEMTVDDYDQMWLGVGIDEEIGEKIKQKTKEFLNDEEMVKKIWGLYEGMVEIMSGQK